MLCEKQALLQAALGSAFGQSLKAVDLLKSSVSYSSYQYINTIKFVFRKDSLVSEKINYDLLKTAHGIQTGKIPAPSLLGGSNVSKTNEDIPKAFTKMMGKDCP